MRDGLKLRPLLLGGSTFDSSVLYPEPDMPELTEAGTQNMPGILSLKESLRFIKKHKDEKRQKGGLLTRYFLQRMQEIGCLRILGEQTEKTEQPYSR